MLITLSAEASKMSARLACITALVLITACAGFSPAQETRPATTQPAVTFNANFEGASVGRIDVLSPTAFRVHVAGQEDERGHNRQASWYYFRMDHVGGREITITLTDLVGEYDDKPGAVPAGPDILPVFSEDGHAWRHVAAGAWDDAKKEMTVTLSGGGDSLYLAHLPPYTPADLGRLLTDVGRCPQAIIEVIGRTASGRDLHLITVTDPDVPDKQKKSLWLQARQHAWEAGTSWVAEGALRFITSDEPSARELRRRTVFRFTPMVDVDGCFSGRVRFNANGYDVNRHWNEVDLRHPEFLRLMPEIWYTKKAIVAAHRDGPDGRGIDLLVNMHNTETAEYIQTHASGAGAAAARRLQDLLVTRSSFDPSRQADVQQGPTGTTNSLSREYGVPVVLMELRIGPGRKLGRRPTTEDRLAFGRDLVLAMEEAVR
jgi:hypothetical protein